jgi:hypothetical protein
MSKDAEDGRFGLFGIIRELRLLLHFFSARLTYSKSLWAL